ncbi:hypothetical protein [Parachlamydia sp. AcF125]|uniref:hypothetical protein n=1 Tax=Parachlamydia sp. AcF125 TaxID=2795736 RepID=UPI001BC8E852|nr:hypothetical protein [Parachlamydia sp. AcF125]MBS4167920.1 hypothetical protein [Parachlamydia sp. AcF125]
MNQINDFLLAEIKAKNVPTSEKVANFLLKPTQYLWNGKKIDFIQENGQKAVQIDLIYQVNEHSWLKTACMITLLIPATFLGAILKIYATCRYHRGEDDTFMKKCLKQGAMGKILTPRGQSQFGEKVRDFIETLQSTGSWNAHLANTNKPLFLSEIKGMRLLYEENHPSAFGGWGKEYMPKAAATNRKILDNIHLLWNLSSINFADHYALSSPEMEKEALKEINPYVISLQVDQLKFTKPVKAKAFFAS